MSYLINNLGLKLVALFLALICWFFVFSEAKKILPEKKQETAGAVISGQIITKQVPVQLVLEGEPADGFKVERNKILVNPNFCLVVGQKDMLDNIPFIRTMPINVSGRSKSFNETVKLEPLSKTFAQEGIMVEVIVPIEKVAKR